MGALVAEAELEPTDFKKLMWALHNSGDPFEAYLVEGGVQVDVQHPMLGSLTYRFDYDEKLVYRGDPW